MAGILCRSGLSLARRPPMITLARGAQKMMADPMEHATGLEKKELEAYARGNDDPFNVKPIKVPPGSTTKQNPAIVSSFFDGRIIGCCCHEDAFYINYMWLYKGDPQRCECGKWFKLVDAKDAFDFKD